MCGVRKRPHLGDLKDHVMATHRSKIELMPNSFLTENNGFWMANYPEVYVRVSSPSNFRAGHEGKNRSH
jgi:hypothetical protein